MSDYPPPPPASPPPPSGPPGAPVGGVPQFDAAKLQAAVKGADPRDLGLIVAGFLLFIFSFVPYYKVTVSVVGYGSASGTGSAWHGFFGWAAMLLAVVGAVIVALPLLGMALPPKVPFVGLVLFVVSLLFVLLALFIVPANTGGLATPGVSVDKGHGWGYWLSLLVALYAGGYSGFKIAKIYKVI